MIFIYQDKSLKTLRRKLRKDSTESERKLWSVLRKSRVMNLKFTMQYSVGKFILDFYCPTLRLAIEVDGSQHMDIENNKYDYRRTFYLNRSY